MAKANLAILRRRRFGQRTALQRILALSPSLLIWPAQGAGWQGTSGGSLAAPGQPLGLGADLSQFGGKTLSEWMAAPTTSELVTNGDFSSGTGWTLGPGQAITGGELVFTAVVSGSAALFQRTFTNGKVYRVDIEIKSLSAGSFRVRAGFGALVSVPASVGVHTVLIQAGSDSRGFDLLATGITTGSIDNVSVRELPGNHLQAGTWASPADSSRALLGRVPVTGRRNLLTRTEDFAAWNNALGGTGVAPTRTTISSEGVRQYERLVFSMPGATSTADQSRITVPAGKEVNPGQNICITIKARCVGVSNATFNVQHLSTPSFPDVSVTDQWQTIVLTGTALALSGTFIFGIRGGSTNPTSLTLDVEYIQVEIGSTPTAYQRVTTALDVTEAGVPDTYYTNFDGVNDYYSLLNAIPITENMTVVRAFKRATSNIHNVGAGNISALTPREAGWNAANLIAGKLSTGTINTYADDNVSTGAFVFTSTRNFAGESVRRNGTVLGTAASVSPEGQLNTIGRSNVTYNNGEISFLALWDRELTGADLALVEQIAASTNGATLA